MFGILAYTSVEGVIGMIVGWGGPVCRGLFYSVLVYAIMAIILVIAISIFIIYPYIRDLCKKDATSS